MIGKTANLHVVNNVLNNPAQLNSLSRSHECNSDFCCQLLGHPDVLEINM